VLWRTASAAEATWVTNAKASITSPVAVPQVKTPAATAAAHDPSITSPRSRWPDDHWV
jgi:hypothetical protein